jgi:hypothetical protein
MRIAGFFLLATLIFMGAVLLRQSMAEFAEPEPDTPCWAHRMGCDPFTCRISTHDCGRPAQGFLGLCDIHELELVG